MVALINIQNPPFILIFWLHTRFSRGFLIYIFFSVPVKHEHTHSNGVFYISPQFFHTLVSVQ